MTTARRKVVIDQDTLTFLELDDIEQKLGKSLSDVFETSQARGMAALVWVTVRREDPEFSYEDALQWGPGDVEERQPDPEADGASDGAKPPNSVGHGESTPPT